MDYYLMNSDNGAWGFMMMLFWLVSIAGIIIVIVLLIRAREDRRERHVDSFDIIRDRYAKGEITKEQFEELKRDLK